MKQDQNFTDVTFRKVEGGSILAVFPKKVWDRQGNITSYMHIGQHGASDPVYYKRLRKAQPEEYQELKEELESIGYRLRVL